MNSSCTFVIRDKTNEYSSVRFALPPVTAANYDATITAMDDIQTAISAMTIGSIASRQLVAFNDKIDDTMPLNPWAQRELGARFFYQETAGGQKKYHLTVPCPDLIVVDVTDGDHIDAENFTSSNALLTLLEANMVSPNGHPVEFYRGKLVGRKN